MAHDADSQLLDPALSPDGTTLAVSRAPWDAQDSKQIALFDVATGNLKQVLTSGPGDETPFWSPDGSQIVFSRDNGIYVISASGPEGSETRIADGSSPTWSNAGGAAPKPMASTARTQHGPTVRGTITTANGGKLVVRLLVRSGKSLLVVGRSTRALLKGGRQAWSATLTKRVRRALKGVHKVPVIVQLTLTPPGGAAVTLVKKVTLRL
jgi:dipeptidyl aminopeptidase/acylaminoacyl peptidase